MNHLNPAKTRQGLQFFTATLLSLFALFSLQACSGGGGGGGNKSVTPTLSVAAASVIESEPGVNPTLDFTLTLSEAASEDVTVTYSTVDDTATVVDNDYIASNADTLVIPAGQTSATIAITVTGDTVLEFDESFTLQISASNATVAAGSDTVTGTILSDDSLAGYYTSNTITTVNEGMGTLDIPAGDFQVIADINRLSIIDLTNNLIYIADISAFDTPTSFTANARIYKAGNYTDDNANISGVINGDKSLDLTLTADSGDAGGDGSYTTTDGVMSLGYSGKNGVAAIDITSEATWSSLTGGIQPITNSNINISTNNEVDAVNLRSCDINSVTLENVISEQTGRIRSFFVSSALSCITSTPLNGFITNFDITNPDDTMLFILFSDNNIHAATLQ